MRFSVRLILVFCAANAVRAATTVEFVWPMRKVFVTSAVFYCQCDLSVGQFVVCGLCDGVRATSVEVPCVECSCSVRPSSENMSVAST